MSRTATFLSKLSTEGKSIAILLFLAFVPFLGMLPMFFFHDPSGYPLGAYALGWLLGSLAGALSYWSIVLISRMLLSKSDAPLYAPVLLVFARLLLYAIVLVISAICTFQPGWFGGFNAFNFYTAAAGLIPMCFVSILTYFLERKKDGGAPTSERGSHD